MARLLGVLLGLLPLGLALSSCERIYEELEPCPHGVSLRFVYDYNMEYANSFARSVDCLTLYIYDADGEYVGTRIVQGAALAEESYRMQLELEEGTYRFLAYGGIACEDRSFRPEEEPAAGSRIEDLRVAMDLDRIAAPVAADRRLHDLFWGELTLATGDLYREGTVEMMKNTNNIRVVLQQESGEPIDAEDFTFRITDNNSLFDYRNDLLREGVAPVTYAPWITGQAHTGVSILGDTVAEESVGVAYAEMSTSRLMTGNDSRLQITRRSDGATVVDFPLLTYLALLRSERYALPPYNMTDDQEYLDRESDYVLFFFLRPDHSWLDTKIVVNNWVVRINQVEL